MSLIVDDSNASKILLTQIHVAATMKKDRQIVVADHSRLTYLFHGDKLCRYDIFGLKRHGNFTACKIEPPDSFTDDSFQDVSYVQVSRYPF